MFDWFRKQPDPAVAALTEANRVLIETLKEITALSTSTNKVMLAFLDGFKVSGEPIVRVVRDLDEYQDEQARLAAVAEAGGIDVNQLPLWTAMSGDD